MIFSMGVWYGNIWSYYPVYPVLSTPTDGFCNAHQNRSMLVSFRYGCTTRFSLRLIAGLAPNFRKSSPFRESDTKLARKLAPVFPCS